MITERFSIEYRKKSAFVLVLLWQVMKTWYHKQNGRNEEDLKWENDYKISCSYLQKVVVSLRLMVLANCVYKTWPSFFLFLFVCCFFPTFKYLFHCLQNVAAQKVILQRTPLSSHKSAIWMVNADAKEIWCWYLKDAREDVSKARHTCSTV